MQYTNLNDKYLGCLLGGAIGDAMGAPVEFLSHSDIINRYGEEGINAFVELPGGYGEFTDDTQMLLFTAEGLLESLARENLIGRADVALTWYAYLRWLYTQDAYISGSGLKRVLKDDMQTGWLTGRRELHKRRAPGLTCLSSLQSVRIGSVHHPLNNSKGCGTVMRIAPVGLVYNNSMKQAFRVGVELSALTHGHPTAYLGGGFLAAVVSGLVQGKPLIQCITQAQTILAGCRQGHELMHAVDAALTVHHRLEGQDLDVEVIEKLGAAWVAEEALAIALLCALHYPHDYRKAILAAVNHSGDSDSTGAITGNLVGLMVGTAGIPQEWQQKLLYSDIVEDMASKLASAVQCCHADYSDRSCFC